VPLIGPELQPLGIEPVPRPKHRSGTFKTAGGLGAAERPWRPAGRIKTAKSQEPHERCRALAGPARPCDASRCFGTPRYR